MTTVESVDQLESRLRKSFPRADIRVWNDIISRDLHMEVRTEDSIRKYTYDMWKNAWILRSCVPLHYDHHEALAKHKKAMQERRDRKCSHRNL